jgi:hypothetical protein
MNYSYRYLALLLLTVVIISALTSCGDKPTLGDVAQVLLINATGDSTQLATNEVHYTNGTGSELEIDMSYENNQWVSFTIPAAEAKTYLVDPVGGAGKTVATAQITGYTTTIYGSNGTLRVDSIDPVKKTFRGTFEFDGSAGVSQDARFRNGAFEKK